MTARPLHLVPATARSPVARTLLAPLEPVVEEQVHGLMSDPRFVIGRLAQALTDLLAGEMPPPDTRTRLLCDALRDAINHREHSCPECPPNSLCPGCAAGWEKAAQYNVLALELGAFSEGQA